MAFTVRHSGLDEETGLFYLVLEAENADELIHFKICDRVELQEEDTQDVEIVSSVKDNADDATKDKIPAFLQSRKGIGSS